MMTVSNLRASNSSSTDFMENLAAYWALQPYDSFNEEVLESTNSSTTAANLYSREKKITSLNFETIISQLNSEEPYVFVIINSADYKKNKSKLCKTLMVRNTGRAGASHPCTTRFPYAVGHIRCRFLWHRGIPPENGTQAV